MEYVQLTVILPLLLKKSLMHNNCLVKKKKKTTTTTKKKTYLAIWGEQCYNCVDFKTVQIT